eukprot:793556-Prymnesium_polylepis.1
MDRGATAVRGRVALEQRLVEEVDVAPIDLRDEEASCVEGHGKECGSSAENTRCVSGGRHASQECTLDFAACTAVRSTPGSRPRSYRRGCQS